MSAEPVVPPEDEFDSERNRTIARIKAANPELFRGLGGVPPATPEQLERWEREETTREDGVSPAYERDRDLEVDRKWQRR